MLVNILKISFKQWCKENNKENLLQEWNYEKNTCTPENVVSLYKKVWWICGQGHEWEATIYDRNRGKGCRYCINQKIQQGKNDLATTHPKLAKEWHPTKNGALKPTDVCAGSGKKVWWQCEEGHEWQAIIVSRRNNRGCAVCSNKKVLIGHNDFATAFPELAKEWHPTENGDVKPTDVTYISNKIVWWKCSKCGYNFTATPKERQYGRTCPHCENKSNVSLMRKRGIHRQHNNLSSQNRNFETLYPELAKEWHPTKNGDLKPSDFKCKSDKKIWWQCKEGHEWQATIQGRIRHKTCPYCSPSGTSKKEQIVLFYLKKYFNIEVNHRIKLGVWETDILIPKLKIVIEYDGSFWHKNKMERDRRKNAYLKNLGYKVYRIREKPLFELFDTSIDFLYNSRDDKDFARVIKEVIQSIDKNISNIEIDIENDCTAINSFCTKTIKEASLLITHPEIAKQWHPTKNGTLQPNNITFGCKGKIWWQCEKGHEWSSSPNNRTNGVKNSSCPFCSNHKVLIGFNDFATTHPDIAKKWHPTKNIDKRPTDFIAGSSKKIWWICGDCGYVWERCISSMVKNASCPQCSSRHKTTNVDLQFS